MRPKVVIAILLAGAGLLGTITWLSKGSGPSPAAPGEPPPVSSVSSNPPPQAPANEPAARDRVAPVAVTSQGLAGPAAPQNQAEHEALVSQRSAELLALAMQDSPAAHQQIVKELKNPDREIRRAALEALEQADDRSVVPQMQQIAEQTDDPAEKQAILDTIDFINLPSLTEYLHQHQKN